MSLQTSIMFNGIRCNLPFYIVWEVMRQQGVCFEDKEGNITENDLMQIIEDL